MTKFDTILFNMCDYTGEEAPNEHYNMSNVNYILSNMGFDNRNEICNLLYDYTSIDSTKYPNLSSVTEPGPVNTPELISSVRSTIYDIIENEQDGELMDTPPIPKSALEYCSFAVFINAFLDDVGRVIQ